MGVLISPTGNPDIKTTCCPSSIEPVDNMEDSTLFNISSKVLEKGTRNGLTPQYIFRRVKVLAFEVKAKMGTCGLFFEMSSAVRPERVKTAILDTSLSQANSLAARVIEIASSSPNSGSASFSS